MPADVARDITVAGWQVQGAIHQYRRRPQHTQAPDDKKQRQPKADGARSGQPATSRSPARPSPPTAKSAPSAPGPGAADAAAPGSKPSQWRSGRWGLWEVRASEGSPRSVGIGCRSSVLGLGRVGVYGAPPPTQSGERRRGIIPRLPPVAKGAVVGGFRPRAAGGPTGRSSGVDLAANLIT